MKKILLLILAFTNFAVSKANPVPEPPPAIGLSELSFDPNGNWVIELWYGWIIPDYGQNSVDSVFICSSSGRSRLKNVKFNDFSGLMLVSNDSLLSNLNINPEGDSIQIEYYFRHYSGPETAFVDPVVFGNFRNATLNAPKIGESIASYSAFSRYTDYNYGPIYENIYSTDESPNIGFENDSTGMCGTLKGKIYDQNNQLLINSAISFYTKAIFGINMSSDGSYSVRVFSYKNHITQLFYNDGSNRFMVDITPIDIDVKPDSVTTADIHIERITSVNEIKPYPTTILTVSPNPVKDLLVQYEISIPVKSSNSYFELISMNGRKVAQIPVTENAGKIVLPANTLNGMYTLRLFVNNKNYANSKIMISGE